MTSTMHQFQSSPFQVDLMNTILSFVSLCSLDSLSELETDIKVFKDSLLKILDEDEIIEELCLTKWTDPRVL